jgi:tight adherence protein C
VELIAALASAVAVFSLVYFGLFARRSEPPARLSQFDRNSQSGRESVLSAPFGQRVAAPIASRVRGALGRLLPASMVTNLERRLLIAGEPMSLHALIVFQVVCLGGGIFMAATILRSGPSGIRLAGTLVFALLVVLLPSYWIRIKTSARRRALLKAFPDAVDLIVTTVEAGLGIDAALSEVGHETRGPLGEELRMAVRETALGRSRRDALQRLVDRTGVPDIKSFVQSLIQAEQTGIPIGQVLRTQAGQVRLRRRQRAEADAQRAPLKMILIIVTLVLPSMLMLIMGPALMRMADTL